MARIGIGDGRDARSELLVVLRALRRRWWIVVACVVLGASAALAYSVSQQTQYSASASLLFRSPTLDNKLFGGSIAADTGDTDPARVAATNLQLVGLQVVAAHTSKSLGGHPTASQIRKKVSIDPGGQADVASITATDSNPRFAAQLANRYATEYIDFRRSSARAKIGQTQQLIQDQLRALPPDQRSGPQGRLLQNQAQQLESLAAIQIGNAELVQPAQVPKSPSSPRTARNVLAGGLLALLFGLALALILDRFDRRLRDRDDIADTYGLPVLAEIPESDALEHGAVPREETLPFAEAEAFRRLRATLRYFNVDRDVRSILITSASPSDGKSTVSWHLAVAAAEAGSRVMLLEADFRRPSVARGHGLASGPGLSELVTQDFGLSDVIQEVPLRYSTDGSGSALDVIVAGSEPPNPLQLIESEKLSDVLSTCVEQYDLVIIDSPPTSVVSDAIPLMRRVSGVLVVAAIGSDRRDAASSFRDQLASMDAPTLGVVANRMRVTTMEYYTDRSPGKAVGMSPPSTPQSSKPVDPERIG